MAWSKENCGVKLINSTLVFPKAKQDEVTVPLSVVDGTVTHYGPCSAVWFFDAPSHSKLQNGLGALFSAQLKESLAVTLTDFPHLAGDLSMVQHVPGGDHTQRINRLQVTFGSSSDPGVQFDIAQCENNLDDIIPIAGDRRASDMQIWGSSGPYASTFLPDMTKLPFMVLGPKKSPLSVMMVQVTQFACGAVSVGTMIAHPFADAQTLAIFMHNWSHQHKTLFGTHSRPAEAVIPALSAAAISPETPRVFDPQLLNQCAAGNIDDASPDPEILQESRSLPSARYDWFGPAPDGDPDRFLPPGITRAMVVSPGTRMPHEDWDHSAPLGHVKLHFSPEQIRRIWESAGKSVSYHDAILAHVWAAVNRARGWNEDERDVSLHIIFGLRKRLGLPSGFLGSPILSTTVTATGRQVSGALSPGEVAAKINGTLSLYTSEALRARIHDLCFEVAPQRFWEGFLGARHMIFTSWAHLRLYDVDFGGFSGKARYVDAKMPEFDGMVWLMEARPVETDASDRSGPVRHWSDDGVDVSMNLSAEAAARLRADPGLAEC